MFRQYEIQWLAVIFQEFTVFFELELGRKNYEKEEKFKNTTGKNISMAYLTHSYLFLTSFFLFELQILIYISILSTIFLKSYWGN